MKVNNLFRNFIVMTAGVAAISLCLAASVFAEKKNDKKKDPFSTQLEQEMNKEGDALKGDAKKEKDKIVVHGNNKANDAYQVFSKTEKDAILGYYAIKSQGLPNGLAKKAANAALTPGWQKKITKGSVIPSDIYKMAEPLPKDIMAQIPALAAGTSLMKVDNRIVKVVDTTKTIVDVIDLK